MPARLPSTDRLAPAGAAILAWLGGRWRDTGLWLTTLVTYLPRRAGRLERALVAATRTVAHDAGDMVRAVGAGGRTGLRTWWLAKPRARVPAVVVVLSRALDVAGVPEALEWLLRAATRTSPLSREEIDAARRVLGPDALRYDHVRIAEGGLLKAIFSANGNRPFAVFHTINLSSSGAYLRADRSLIVHELIHVYQYERLGSLYVFEALQAQRSEGYGYDGEEGLERVRNAGRSYRHFNREQQAQIAQDYFRRLEHGEPHEPYLAYIDELRQGHL